ncbi:hypothetical protein CCHR01_16523 [Colletotrichum chrysophilum]|uniref:Uncharacterized protein n=1 Tax=Colletotrichum chrysophilum TaxID=1836956 RepID=A0AAD9A8A5_9PEZI|nr:hypothetical protein K456DRAFT_47041 [Colletotrichum gloeosporioides 23]KAK1840844.1 hypothetical protein CCHR01_16523 [Colletotrichum chrysophilum]
MVHVQLQGTFQNHRRRRVNKSRVSHGTKVTASNNGNTRKPKSPPTTPFRRRSHSSVAVDGSST